jgi:hypothetical protein
MAKANGKVMTQGGSSTIHASMLSMTKSWMITPYNPDILEGVQACMRAMQENIHIFPKSIQLKVAGKDAGFAPAKAYVNAVMVAVAGMIAVGVVTFAAENPAGKIPSVILRSLATINGNIYSRKTANEEAVDILADTTKEHKVNREADPFLMAEVISHTCSLENLVTNARKIIENFNRQVFNPLQKISPSAANLVKNVLNLSQENRRKLSKASCDVDKW